MESMDFNKICAAVLTAGIGFSALGLVADDLSHPNRLKESVLKIKGAETTASPAAAAPAALPPIAPLLAKADPAAGEAFTHKICIACHNFKEGQGNKVGPLLYGVVGREKASYAGFTYSAALKSKGGKWTFTDLNEWLHKPSEYAPGTKMAYAGIDNDQMRANVIDYLRTLSDHPEPLPPVTAADTAQPAKSASAAPSAPAEPPLDTLLAKADPARGQAYTKKICIACHNFNEGGTNKVGPLLYGVVGRDKASYPGFTYSSALKSKGGKWTYEDLNKWLTKPSAFAPGTKMAYAGQENAQLRADVIDYLRTLSPHPEKLPGGATPAADTSAKPAEAGGSAGSTSPQKPVSSAPAPAKPAVVSPAPATNTPAPGEPQPQNSQPNGASLTAPPPKP